MLVLKLTRAKDDPAVKDIADAPGDGGNTFEASRPLSRPRRGCSGGTGLTFRLPGGLAAGQQRHAHTGQDRTGNKHTTTHQAGSFQLFLTGMSVRR